VDAGCGELHPERPGGRLSRAQEGFGIGAVSGLNRKPTRTTAGAISLSSSGHLPPNVGSFDMNPVIDPPGRARLATNPLPTGSETLTKMIGIARLSPASAATATVVSATIKSGFCSTTSLARRARSMSPVTQ
jgi:hypothetical protein